jgi:hypothetical protein
MSADVCVFSSPKFTVSGANKIMTGTTSASSEVHIIDTATTVDLEFTFTSDTNSFTAHNATFKFEVYKYNFDNDVFERPAVYKSNNISYSAFSATSSITQSILVDDLQIDGDYLIKGFYIHDVCTEFLKRLGLKNDTSIFVNGTEYDIYDSNLDYYFVAMGAAQEPIFNTSTDNLQPIGSLLELTLFPSVDDQTEFIITRTINPDSVVTLNGLTLAENEDYTLVLSANSSVLTFSAGTKPSDIINVIYVANSEFVGLVSDTITVDDPIVSGTTNDQGDNVIYFNTGETKYEVYTTLTPVTGNDVIITLNGVTLANNVDYYQSITNPKRFILEGKIIVGDVINIIYNGYPEYVGDIFTNTPTIYWSIGNPPQLANGTFVLQVATDDDFVDIISSATTDYVADQAAYSADVTITGSVGTELFYRVCNNKNYVTLDGDIIMDLIYSETVPIIIQSNSINSY